MKPKVSIMFLSIMFRNKNTKHSHFVYSPGILGFEMEKNNIKLTISGSVHCVLLYYL